MIVYLKDTLKTLQELNYATIKAIKFGVFGVIIADVIGIYWYLGFKKFAIAFLFVLLIILSGILLLERREIQPMENNNETERERRIRKLQEELNELKDNKKEKKKEKSNNDNSFMDGLMDFDDYNERMDKAFGTL